MGKILFAQTRHLVLAAELELLLVVLVVIAVFIGALKVARRALRSWTDNAGRSLLTMRSLTGRSCMYVYIETCEGRESQLTWMV